MWPENSLDDNVSGGACQSVSGLQLMPSFRNWALATYALIMQRSNALVGAQQLGIDLIFDNSE